MEALKWIVDALKKGATDLANDPAGYIGSAARDVLPKPQPLEYDESGRTVIPKTVDQAGARWLMDNFGLLGMTVYHGSPHKFSKFDMSKMGTGEGNQAYGHGLYFAENPKVAQQYADEVKNVASVNDINRRMSELANIMSGDSVPGQYRKFRSQAGKDAAAEYDSLMMRREGVYSAPGNLYKADIPDDLISQLLDWDAPISGQPEAIRYIAQDFDLPANATGGDLHKALVYQSRDGAIARGQPSGLSDAQSLTADDLRELGVPGIKYFDGQSRAGAEGTRNFVLFDDRLPRILEINGQPTGAQPWKAGEYDALIKALRR